MTETFWYYRTANQSPKVTAEFLARQQRVLLPGQYAREHQNQWSDGADSYTTAAEVDAAEGHGWTEQWVGQPGLLYDQFWDLGWVDNPTVGAVGHHANGLIYIDRLLTLQGSREAPVLLPVVQAHLLDLASRFPPGRIRVESPQGLQMSQQLRGLSVPVEVLTPTAKSNSEEWPVLAERLRSRTLVLFPHARLREELLNLTYEMGPSGIKVVDPGSVHQDHAVAVRGVVASLAKRMYQVPLIFRCDERTIASSEPPTFAERASEIVTTAVAAMQGTATGMKDAVVGALGTAQQTVSAVLHRPPPPTPKNEFEQWVWNQPWHIYWPQDGAVPPRPDDPFGPELRARIEQELFGGGPR